MYVIPFRLAHTDQDFAQASQGCFVTNYFNIGEACRSIVRNQDFNLLIAASHQNWIALRVRFEYHPFVNHVAAPLLAQSIESRSHNGITHSLNLQDSPSVDLLPFSTTETNRDFVHLTKIDVDARPMRPSNMYSSADSPPSLPVGFLYFSKLDLAADLPGFGDFGLFAGEQGVDDVR